MKALVFDRFGEPADVLHVREVPTPEPGPGQVRVRMIASPINPSDLLVVRGRYGVLPTLPATPGFEGVGVVDRAGPGLLGRLVVRKRVAAINDKGGNWAEYAILNARQARPVSADLPNEQVASFFVNPATVLAMVRHVLAVPKGGWLLQSAANSNLGKMVIRLARHDGIRTVNVVRRRAAVAELKALGADVVIAAEDGPIEDQVRAALGTDAALHAIDPVGGAIGSAVLRSLGPGGRLVVYGSLTEEPLQVDARGLIAGDRTVEGFWLGRWMRQQHIPRLLGLFREIGSLIRQGVLATEVGPSFPPEAIGAAVAAAEGPGRAGKVLLWFD
jgi:NADPH:quinone reductase-like Zn-dependent oxidoreductase